MALTDSELETLAGVMGWRKKTVAGGTDFGYWVDKKEAIKYAVDSWEPDEDLNQAFLLLVAYNNLTLNNESDEYITVDYTEPDDWEVYPVNTGRHISRNLIKTKDLASEICKVILERNC